MRNRITIADVAAKAGVSMMTVSRAINNKEGISEVTRARILKIATEMGFQPSSIARGLATKRTATAGLVVPDIANPFFAEIARGVEDVAYAHHYNVFLLNSSENTEREQKALESLWAKQVDGLIWCSSRLTQPQLHFHLDRFAYAVLINRELETPVPGVVEASVDDAAGARQAVDHFVRQGRQQIALIAGPAHSFSSQKRQRGFWEACAAHEMVVDPARVRHCDPTSAGGYQAVASLLAEQPRVDAILAYNDLVAVGALQACAEIGCSVPEDVAIIGIDDIPLAALVTPSLSTVRVDKYKFGHRAMNTLLRLINSEGHDLAPRQTIQPELILRQSAPEKG